MKKQASDQQFHDRRHQERKRAEAAKKSTNKQTTREGAAQPVPGTAQDTTDKKNGKR
jgi:hypothetical protein